MPTVIISDNTTGRDFTGTIDAQIKENAATTNYGTGVDFAIARYVALDWTYALIAFTGLSNITGPVVVDASSTLELYPVYWGGANPQTITSRRLLRNWTEAGVTWNKFDGTTDWASAGADDVTDRSSTVTEARSVATSAGYKVIATGAQLALDIQDFINDAASNYGWHLDRTDAENDSAYIGVGSSEGTDGQRPKLTVVYTAAGIPPRSLAVRQAVNRASVF